MSLIASKLKRLRLLAKTNAMEVEHLLKLAKFNDVLAVPVIQELRYRYNWIDQWPISPDANGCREIPFGVWADVVCCYLAGGTAALINYASDRPSAINFVIAVLTEVGTEASVVAIAEIIQSVAYQPLITMENKMMIANDITNLFLILGEPNSISNEIRLIIRNFLHAMLSKELPASQRATFISALSGVGDQQSLELISSNPNSLEYPWQHAEKRVKKAILKRLNSLGK